MGVRVTVQGEWKATEDWLRRMARGDVFSTLDRFGQMGVDALAQATPVLSGIAAGSWSYEIENRSGYFSIRWVNSHEVAGQPLVILLQYGHGTRQGGYVEGQDFINPAIRPVFDQIDAELRKVVTQ